MSVELEESKKIRELYSYLKRLLSPPPCLALTQLEARLLRKIGCIDFFYFPEALKASTVFRSLREKKLVNVGKICVRSRLRSVVYLTPRGESTYRYLFKTYSWSKYSVPRVLLKAKYPSGYYLEGFCFNNLAQMLLDLAPILAKSRVIYVATSDWKCFTQKILALRKWLPDQVVFYIRDLNKQKVKVYLNSF
ncbi:MAG: hypothetical protein DRN04_10765 [Thermoprotei archaeon]|nr:MAG: hypothetical protein DRN04_10765 [Thermoprotei archaeon]